VEKIFCTRPARAVKAGKNLLYVQLQHEELNEPTKKGPLSYVLHESPFATVSTRETSEGWPLLTVLKLKQLGTYRVQ
jgi:hypothetical protein